jgi:archaellum component FlaG (FlaF/FlaG flagellin family)
MHAVAGWLVTAMGWLDTHGGAVTAMATGVIAWFTISLARASRHQAALSTDQIKLARQEFNAVHRPRIILREAYTAPDVSHLVTVMFNIENTGGSEATIVDSKFTIFYSTAIGTKRQVVFGGELQPGEINRPIPTGLKIQAGSSHESSCSAVSTYWSGGWSDRAFAKAAGEPRTIIPDEAYRAAHVYFYGKISYNDSLGVVRNMAFYRVLDFHSYRFVAFGDPQLEYTDERP